MAAILRAVTALGDSTELRDIAAHTGRSLKRCRQLLWRLCDEGLIQLHIDGMRGFHTLTGIGAWVIRHLA